MSFQVSTPDLAAWGVFVTQQPRAHFLQLPAWGEHKRAYGWDCARLAVTEEGQIVAGAQLLFRALPLRLGTMAYLPMGPYAAAGDSEALNRALWDAVHTCARQHKAAWLKWEPGLYREGVTPDPARMGFRASAQTIQPPRTIVIDISCDDETILARMNQGTRRKIRQSLKQEVRYFEGSRADVAGFTAMMDVTGARGAFGVHEPAYYALAYDLFVPQYAALFLAEHHGDLLAGIMVFAAGPSAWYVYGASSNEKRTLMASYGVQWQAIQWAKARGCTHYDMWGIPDEDEAALEAEFERRSDGLWGVYGFKRGWGGRIVRSPGAWDYVYNPLLYAGYQAALMLRD